MQLEKLDWDAIQQEALTLFKDLLRIDTTNPPGNERPAADLLAESLREDGIEPWIAESAPGRANLVARLPANRESNLEPLLLAGHTDVVPANADEWTHPPFAAVEADEMIWGRGAVDMKNMVAMSAMVIKVLARHPELPRHRDLIFAAVADEEEGCAMGSTWLVENHPERVKAEFMLGEVGGFWLNIGAKTYVPIMVAEKGRVHLRMRARGAAGHGSIPNEESALVRLSRAIARLDKKRLPYRLTPVVETFIRRLAATQPMPDSAGLLGLLDRRTAPLVLKRLLPDRSQARAFHAMLHNTATPTIFNAGGKLNVIPDEATCDLDGRTLPGQTAQDLAREVREAIADPEIEVEILESSPPVVAEPMRSDLFATIEHIVAREAPGVLPIPYMITGFTDARAFHRLGMRCYGFSPLMLEPRHELKFTELFHGVDERAPVAGFAWGQKMLLEVVSAFLAKQG
ncbi:MAG: M20/M25/M40 family metallo-hydrolase [Myxococcota bacterium]|nr:M20/M25/M40 family metallo-hydrolase [Myxococcota bacterium]